MDYRLSHLSPTKGITYDASFKNLPYRKIVWEWEKDVLRDIVMGIRRARGYTRYLDFACGTGRIIEFLEDLVDESIGIDISPSMLDVASMNVKRSKLILGDITQKPIFEENYFDFITAFRFFLNAQQDLRESVLHVLGKTLKKDGYLIINIHMNKGCLLEKELRAYQLLKNIKNPYFHSMGVQETKNMLRNFHFDVLKTFHYGVLPIYREQYNSFLDQIDLIERYCSRFSSLLRVSRYIIYVCRLNSTQK